MFRNSEKRERGTYFHTRYGRRKRQKEEKEIDSKHLIIVPCFKYYSNVWLKTQGLNFN